MNIVTLSGTLVTQLRYHRWATGIVLEEAIALSAEQLMTPIESSFACIYDTIVHLYQSDRIWLDRLEGRPSGKFEDYEAPGCMWELRDAWVAVQERMLDYASSLRDAEREIDYKNLAGHSFRSSIWQIILHIVNHGTHHRGQITTMLRQLGVKPENLDLIRFYRTVDADQAVGAARS
jgi:uncharacterized damage-inducible protein DinB